VVYIYGEMGSFIYKFVKFGFAFRAQYGWFW